MLLRDFYQLSFVTNVINGKKRNVCISTTGDYANLSFLGFLNKSECQGLIDDLGRCLDFQSNGDQSFISDSVEDITILYQYPNVNIDDILIIPMVDLKELAQEWLDFITAA